ncbi:ABC transporter ATP-binding protein, partial [Burkholderia pseudomallei]|uniref:hypothetical protein n=1 Tax=Burkholderia pseudomallei TaxID=28450 RepID=UPI001CC3097C
MRRGIVIAYRAAASHGGLAWAKRAASGRLAPPPAELVTSMYLGDRWEYLFHCGALRLRAFGTVPR